jgi:PII-like signaling protein
MKIASIGKLLRTFIGESDHYKGRPLYEYIVLRARELGLAGITVIRGIEGYGATTKIHTAKIFRLNVQLPVVIEVVDAEDKIKLIRDEIDKAFENCGCGGLVTVEDVEIVKYTPGKGCE